MREEQPITGLGESQVGERLLSFWGGERSMNRPSGRNPLSGLRQVLETKFDVGELRSLCFDLGIDYDDLAGSRKADRARELVAYLERHDRLLDLIEVGKQVRPDVDWEGLVAADLDSARPHAAHAMAPAALAAAVMEGLGPYLVEAGAIRAEQTGEAAWARMAQVHKALRAKLADKSYARETLERLEDRPDSEARRAALRGILEDELEADVQFARQLQQLLDEAGPAGVPKTIVQQVNVSGHGRIEGPVTQIGEASGPVNVGGGKRQ